VEFLYDYYHLTPGEKSQPPFFASNNLALKRKCSRPLAVSMSGCAALKIEIFANGCARQVILSITLNQPGLSFPPAESG